MPLLPTDFGLPPLPHLTALLVVGVATLWLCYRRRPPATPATVAALSPWMAAGGALYALYQVDAVPAAAAPLFGSPAVYGSVGIVAGLAWAAVADRPGDGWDLTTAPGILGAVGTALLVAVLAAVLAVGLARGSLSPGWSALSLLVAVALTAVAWAGLRRTDAAATGAVGAVAVFGHVLDGVSTAVGYDALGLGEQTPLSRLVLEAGAGLPVADLLGAGWLFAAVKLALAAGIVYFFADYVREAPSEGSLLLGLIAAVGLGPGAHNLVLFALI